MAIIFPICGTAMIAMAHDGPFALRQLRKSRRGPGESKMGHTMGFD